MSEYMFVFGSDIAAERLDALRAIVKDHLTGHEDLHGLIIGGIREPFSVWDLETGRTYEYRPAVKPVPPPPDMTLLETKNDWSPALWALGLVCVPVLILFGYLLGAGAP